MRPDPNDAALAKLAFVLHELPEWHGRPAADYADVLAELGLSAAASETVLRHVRGLTSGHADAFQRVRPPDVPGGCPIDWRPSVLHPVFAYWQHYDESSGAPGPLEVFYPSRRWITSRFDTGFLAGCGPYPLVIFLHGHCTGDAEQYKRWLRLPYSIARCGYVVVVPSVPSVSLPWGPFGIDRAVAVLDWMRNGWEHREHLAPAPATGVVGHSYGAVIGARLALRIGASAYVGLSGGWRFWQGAESNLLLELNLPTLFAWGGSADDFDARLDEAGMWDPIPSPKHQLVFDGGAHWDYLYASVLPCSSSNTKGPCSLVPYLAADYAALFLSRYLPPPGAGIDGLIPPSLVPPTVARTPLQDLLASWHLEGLRRLPMEKACKLAHVAEPRHLVDRSAESGTPSAAAPPTACVIPGLGVHNIAYRDTSGHLHELWRDAQGGTGTTDLTDNAGAPKATGTPFAYVDTTRNTEILLFRDDGGTVRSLYWSTGPVGHDDLSGTAHAPDTAGDPVGYYDPAADTHHVIYRTGNGHLHELWWTGVAPVGYGGDLTSLASAPAAAGDPSAFIDGSGFNIVVYRGGGDHIRSLYWTTGAVAHEDLSASAGTPAAAGEPVAYYTAHDDTHQIVYRGKDGHLWELFWPGVVPVVGWNLTAALGAPAAVGRLAAFYSAGTHTKHVIYRSGDGRLHDIRWAPGGGVPVHLDLAAAYGAPAAADGPAAFAVDAANTRHVAYRGTDKHIYEVLL